LQRDRERLYSGGVITLFESVLESVMSVMAIVIGLCLIALIGGVAYWFAIQEQKTMKSGPVELDERTRQAERESASSITNADIP